LRLRLELDASAAALEFLSPQVGSGAGPFQCKGKQVANDGSTELLFRDDAYLKEIDAVVVAVHPGAIALDRTVFYPQGGGQPGDRGRLILDDGSVLDIVNTTYGADRGTILHQLTPGAPTVAGGARVLASLDWSARYARMRAHTALHLLTAVLPFPVTGGSVGDAEGRLDFDSGEAALDKAEVAEKLNALIAADAPVETRWITDDELAANPSLVKTMSVKPPTGTGRVRLVRIGEIDLQPCGGTHVRHTLEIGTATVTQIEKKGRINRRVRIALSEASA
jgi:misacylated tRNA(Ala) deacylase